MRALERWPWTVLVMLAVCLVGSSEDTTGPAYRVDHRLEADQDRLDRSVYYSAPDSLRLNANLGENGYYRFQERPVNGGVKHRLTFHYLVAIGSVGTCSVNVRQYHDTKLSWKVLDVGTVERVLPVVGRWQVVTMDFVTELDATSVAVTFRVDSPCDVCEAWVDDVVLRPVGILIIMGP